MGRLRRRAFRHHRRAREPLRRLRGRPRLLPQDVRFTKKGDIVYAFLMGWPADGKAVIKSLATGAANFPREVAKVELLGSGEVKFSRDAAGLAVNLPQQKPNDFAYALKITPA